MNIVILMKKLFSIPKESNSKFTLGNKKNTTLENFYLLIQESYDLESALSICSKIKPHKDISLIQDDENERFINLLRVK